MKRFSISTMLWILLLLSVFSCEDLGIQPATDETAIPLTDITQMGPSEMGPGGMAQANNENENIIILYLNYTNKKTEKIEVNRHQATLNFDNHDPQIVSIELSKNEKMVNLKNFRAEYNQLKGIPSLALIQGIKRIEVAHNRIQKLPVMKKNTSLKLLDISYNEMKVSYDELLKLRLPSGAILNLTKTGISCKFIQKYMKEYPEVTVISDCEKIIKPTPIPIIKK